MWYHSRSKGYNWSIFRSRCSGCSTLFYSSKYIMSGEVMQKKNWIKSDGCASVYFHVSLSKGLSKLLHDLVKKAIQIFFFFSIRVFFHRHWQLTGQQGKGGDFSFFHSTTSTRSRTFRHLCAIQMMTITTFLGGTPTESWSMPQEPYIIWLSFMIHMCEVIYLLVVFSFFQNFDVLGC